MVDKPDYGKQEDAWRIERCRIDSFSGLRRVPRPHLVLLDPPLHDRPQQSGNGIRLRGWDGFILDNWLSGNGDAGYGAYEENAAITMTANRIEWNRKAGIEIHAGNSYNITGNYIDRSGGPGIKLVPGRSGDRARRRPARTSRSPGT